ncbi:hypothetical protein ACQKM2_01755 [Streptomyces sp. NPDC004126]|uniref:hypothetical protein n=1 Tax=Streptomyces sp. NPDC004126 TaxID=3390695 RepID=UPI003D026866
MLEPSDRDINDITAHFERQHYLTVSREQAAKLVTDAKDTKNTQDKLLVSGTSTKTGDSGRIVVSKEEIIRALSVVPEATPSE